MNINKILAKHEVTSSINLTFAIKEIIEETLRMAYEKSRVEGNKGVLREEILVRDLEYEESYWVTVNKQSILDVIKQIEI